MDEATIRNVYKLCRIPEEGFKGFDISHSGRGYWIVKGLVPIHVARLIYHDPVGRLYIRVAGHCGPVPPEPPWTRMIMPDGTFLSTVEAKESFIRNFRNRYVNVERNPVFAEYTFTDDPVERAKAKECVELYHIDTNMGLRIFVDYLRWFELV